MVREQKEALQELEGEGTVKHCAVASLVFKMHLCLQMCSEERLASKRGIVGSWRTLTLFCPCHNYSRAIADINGRWGGHSSAIL